MTTNKILEAILERLGIIDKRLDGVDKRLDGVDKKLDVVDKRLDSLDANVEKVSRQVVGNTERLDKLGNQLAYLEDDSPTRDEFDKLEGRVEKLESGFVTIR